MRTFLFIVSFAAIIQAVPSDDNRIRVVATATDAEGNFVRNLQPGDFVLEEDGKALPFASFTTDIDTPITIGILLDDSLSMQLNHRWEAAINLCRIVIRMMKPQDEFKLMRFAADMTEVQGFTSDRSKIESYLRELGPTEAGTDVVRSVEKALVELRKGHNYGKGLILISDAEDNGGGNVHAMSDWINTREVPVFTVAVRPPKGTPTTGFGGGFGGAFGGFGRGVGAGTLNVGTLLEGLSLAEPRRGFVLETGDVHNTDTPVRIARFVQDMESDLRGQYQFGFSSKHVGPSWERIVRIRVPARPDVKVRSRWVLQNPQPASPRDE